MAPFVSKVSVIFSPTGSRCLYWSILISCIPALWHPLTLCPFPDESTDWGESVVKIAAIETAHQNLGGAQWARVMWASKTSQDLVKHLLLPFYHYKALYICIYVCIHMFFFRVVTRYLSCYLERKLLALVCVWSNTFRLMITPSRVLVWLLRRCVDYFFQSITELGFLGVGNLCDTEKEVVISWDIFSINIPLFFFPSLHLQLQQKTRGYTVKLSGILLEQEKYLTKSLYFLYLYTAFFFFLP